MNSTNRQEKPTLNGQRIKTRKRDEKEKHDPGGFRDSILNAIADIVTGTGPIVTVATSSSTNSTPATSAKTSPDSESAAPLVETALQASTNGSLSPPPGLVTKGRLDALSKFLDERGSKKDDYRKYGEVLFDVLIAGGILAPGGNIIDSDADRIGFCVFTSCQNEEDIRGFAHVFLKLIRRYKYLEKVLEDEFKKIIKFLKGFTPEERLKLAKLTGILIAGNQIHPIVLTSAIHDQSVRDGCAGQFLVNTLQIWLADKDKSTVWNGMKKAGLDQKIYEFFPSNRRTPECLEQTFLDNGLGPLLDYQRAGMSDRAKKELQNQVSELIKESASNKEIIAAVQESMSRHNLIDHEVIVMLWNTLMNSMEWSKKEEMVGDQAIRHLRTYAPLLKEFAQNDVRAEIALINRIQEFSYEYINFLKNFIKVIQLFYKLDVLNEDAILKWYREAHSHKGKSIFLEQAKEFVTWLETADEESD